MNSVEDLVIKFRKAIDDSINAKAFNGNDNFKRFPDGCCGYASDLLAKYLYSNGVRTWYISGEYSEGSSWETQNHAWLQTDDGTILDITGDQFKKHRGALHYEEKVYVGKMDYFHSLFETQPPIIGYEEPEISWMGETDVQRLLRQRYEKIKKYL